MPAMSANETAHVLGPSETIDGQGGVVHLDITGTAQLFKIPSEWKGRLVRVSVVGEDVEIQFGDSAVTVTWQTASSVDGTTKVITQADATGDIFFAGQADHFWVHPRHTHFAAVAASTSGKVYIRPT